VLKKKTSCGKFQHSINDICQYFIENNNKIEATIFVIRINYRCMTFHSNNDPKNVRPALIIRPVPVFEPLRNFFSFE
jgi:hypothetical protein